MQIRKSEIKRVINEILEGEAAKDVDFYVRHYRIGLEKWIHLREILKTCEVEFIQIEERNEFGSAGSDISAIVEEAPFRHPKEARKYMLDIVDKLNKRGIKTRIGDRHFEVLITL